MNTLSFNIDRLPQVLFGAGRSAELVILIKRMNARRLLFVTGANTLVRWTGWDALRAALEADAREWFHTTVATEPTPQIVDSAVIQHHSRQIDLVVAIGGGSVLDAAKAIAGLLPFGNSVLDHLEGVGAGKPYHGPALPFIAVPTTAGTGSEATKNAVLSVVGNNGYKKSFRHDTLVPQYAIVDPDWIRSCPPAQIAANGLDALTQLLESYVSMNATPFTDVLALDGIGHVRKGLFAAWQGGNSTAADQGRAHMAYAALMSGITLAQAGLGSVHGLASPLGAFFPIPHGVVCGALLAAATEINVRVLRNRTPDSLGLMKYAEIGRLLSGEICDDKTAQDRLISLLRDWTGQLQMPRLCDFGVQRADFPYIVANCRGNSMKTNPILLTDEDVTQILRQCV